MLPDEKFLSELLSCPSITPNDAGASEIIAQYLGVPPRIFDNNKTTNRLFEIQGQHPKPEKYLLFVGHTDVVPTGPLEQWNNPPFEYQHSDPIIARGIVDMKGAIWAFCCAAKNKAHYLNATIGILLTSDEEGDGIDGIQTVVEKLQKESFYADYALVGEPTSINHVGDCYKHARRGSFTIYATIGGTQGHTAYPQNSWSPSIPLQKILLAFTQYKQNLPKDHDASIFSINTPTHTSNIIPDSVQIGINIRYFDPIVIIDCIKFLKQHGVIITEHPGAKPYASQPSASKRALEKAIKDTVNLQAQSSTLGGTSDARFLAPITGEIIEFGLRSQYAHHINEQATHHDLEHLVLIYEKFLINLLGV